MRLSFTQFFQTGINTLNAQQADLVHLYQQVGSGQRMVTPADDPLAAAQTINIAQAQAANHRHAENRKVLKTHLGAEDTELKAAINLLREVKTRLVQAGNGTLSDADRESLATVLANMRETLMGIANSTDGNGQYLFSGHKGSQAAFDTAGGSYLGDTGQRLIQADATRRIAASDTGADVFARAPTSSRAWVTSADAGNQGSGQIANPQMADAGHDWAGGSFTVQFETDGAGGLQYVISGVDGKGQAIPPQAPIPFDPASEQLEIKDAQGRVALRVAFAGQAAVRDTFSITAASDVQGLDMNVFHTLDALVKDLRLPVDGGQDDAAKARLANTLTSAMQKISLNFDQLLTVEASIGSRLNEIDALDDAGQQRNLGWDWRLGQLENVDYYTAISQLQLRKTALEAAASAFKQIQSTSLFNMGSH